MLVACRYAVVTFVHDVAAGGVVVPDHDRSSDRAVRVRSHVRAINDKSLEAAQQGRFRSNLSAARQLVKLRRWKPPRAQVKLFRSASRMARRLPTTNPPMESASSRHVAGIVKVSRDRAAPPFSWVQDRSFTVRLVGKASAAQLSRLTISVARIRAGTRSRNSSQGSFLHIDRSRGKSGTTSIPRFQPAPIRRTPLPTAGIRLLNSEPQPTPKAWATFIRCSGPPTSR